MENSDLLELKADIEEFIKDTTQIQDDFLGSVRRLNIEFRNVDTIFSKHHRQKKVFNDLRTQLKELEHDNDSNLDDIEGLRMKLQTSKTVVDNLGKAKRKTGSYFVALIMGKVSMRVWNEGDRFQFKSEYNRFKEKMMYIYFFFPMLQFLFGFSMIVHQMQSFAFLYFYSSLAIRENILSLNGSRIESWWIYHHYWSIFVSILSILILDHSNPWTVETGIFCVNLFTFWQGIVFMLQQDYQKKRHYARKALNKKSQFDIRTTEVIDETPHARYKLLIPTLYMTYFFQLAVSMIFLYVSCFEDLGSHTQTGQMLMMSLSWAVLSIGNCTTLAKVLKKKSKRRQNK